MALAFLVSALALAVVCRCFLRVFWGCKRGLFNKGVCLLNGPGAPCELLVFTAFALLLFTVPLAFFRGARKLQFLTEIERRMKLFGEAKS